MTLGDSQRLLSITADGIQIIFSDWVFQTKVLEGCEGGSQEHIIWTEHLKYWAKYFLAVRVDKGTPMPSLENKKRRSAL